MSEGFKEALEGLAAGVQPSPETGAPKGPAADDSEHPSVVALRVQFGESILHHEVQSGDEHVVFIAPERSTEILRWLKTDAQQAYTYLADITAVDYGGGRPLQVLYQLWSIEFKRQLRIKAELPLVSLEIDSAYPVWAAANWLEREVYDLFGIQFRGHPDMRRIMMPENYAEGHPLRKDFPLRGRFSRAEQTRRALAMEVEDYYIPTELEVAEESEREATREMGFGGPE
jgi:NADH-quinone oxidoreductase subunit C